MEELKLNSFAFAKINGINAKKTSAKIRFIAVLAQKKS